MTEYVCSVEGCSRTFDNPTGLANHENRGHNEPFHEKETLNRLYWEEEMSLVEIADKFDTEPILIQRWMEKHGLETRDHQTAVRKSLGVNRATYYTDKRGYEIATCGTSKKAVKVHRLIAYCEHGDEVHGMHVHHENRNTWDNRPDNLTLKTPGEHTSDHHDEGIYSSDHMKGESHPMAKLTRKEVQEIRSMQDSEKTHSEIAEQYGVSKGHVSSIITGKRWQNQ